jgi:tol-pal system protein YbgF
MREEIERIQVDRDRANEEALGLSPEAAEARAASVAPVPLRPRVPAPAFATSDFTIGGRTANEGADEGEGLADTEDRTPRPVIRVIGSARMAGGRHAADQVVEQTFPGSPEDDRARFAGAGWGSYAGGAGDAAAVRPSALDPEARRAYDAALALVNARRYDKALDALASFLLKWPDHPYADNAMFWRGECYFASGDYLRASEQFEGVISRFPAGNKVPDALLKLGICDEKLGNFARAKLWYARLAQQYPQSEAARQIPKASAPTVTPGPEREDAR